MLLFFAGLILGGLLGGLIIGIGAFGARRDRDLEWLIELEKVRRPE